MVEHVYPNSDHTKRKNPDLSKKRREKKFSCWLAMKMDKCPTSKNKIGFHLIVSFMALFFNWSSRRTKIEIWKFVLKSSKVSSLMSKSLENNKFFTKNQLFFVFYVLENSEEQYSCLLDAHKLFKISTQ